MVSRLADRQHLIDQVVNADWTWFERANRRMEAEDDDSDGASEAAGDEEPEDDHPLEISVTVGIRRPQGEAPPEVRIRERMTTQHEVIASTLDVEVRFKMDAEFPIDDNDVVKAFVDNVAGEYVLGFLRSAYADDCRTMGIEPPLVPAISFNWGSSRDDTEDQPKD